MNKLYTGLTLPFMALLLLVSACKKKEDDKGGGPGSLPGPLGMDQLYNYADGDALFVASDVYTVRDNPAPMPDEQVRTGGAYAVFRSATGATTYLDAGEVMVEDTLLEKDSDNQYWYTGQNQVSPTVFGIPYGNSATWDVSGNGTIPAISNYKTNHANQSLLTTATRTDTVDMSKDYKVEVYSAASSDTLMVILASGGTYIEKRVGGPYSVTFTPDEMAALDPTGIGLLQVVQYRIKSNTTSIPGKKSYFVMMTSMYTSPVFTR